MEDNPFKELIKPRYLQRAQQRARQRAQRQRSPWNHLLVPFVAGSVVAIWFGLIGLIFGASSLVTSRSFSERSDAAFTFTVMPLMIPSMALGMIAGNFLLHCIRPARRILDAEMRDCPGADYRTTQRQLWILGRYVVAIFVTISLLVAIFVP